jgi:epoxyqueuosine reductase QueG
MGAKAFGVADLEWLGQRESRLLNDFSRSFSRAVVLGMRLQDGVLEEIRDRPTPLYFHNYRQLNYQLDRAAFTIADRLQDAGHAAVAIPASQIVARNPMRGHVSHKWMGWAAGLGFIGRSTLLVHPQYGARLRYVSVLTNAPLPAGRPIGESCGDCRACVGVCPAAAIREEAGDFDLDACYSKLTEFTRLPFIGQHICGVCVRACAGRQGPQGAATSSGAGSAP